MSRITLELLKEGEFRAEAHHLGLEQELPADACVNIFFLAHLKPILERYGNRGYRACSSRRVPSVAGSNWLRMPSTWVRPLTFFDDDVVHFFSPHARDKIAVFLSVLDWQAAETQTTVEPTPGLSPPKVPLTLISTCLL